MARRYSTPSHEQLELIFSPVRNNELFSNHWLERRLYLEPEWQEFKEEATKALKDLLDLWKRERNRVEKYDNEQSLEYAFIQPVLEILGWKFIYQTYLRRREPDYALFFDEDSKDRALSAGKKSENFWKHTSLVADAKTWKASLERPFVIDGRKEYPPEQIEWYIDKSRLDYGILTNGRLWRLVPREHAPDQRRFQTYFECNLPDLFEKWENADALQDTEVFEDFFRFYLFFSPAAFRSIKNREPLIERARTGSSEYRLGIGEDLKMRVFEALRYSIDGFLKYMPNSLKPNEDLTFCREQSFIFLYRLLFIMFAEDRQLLPYKLNRLYTENRALSRHRDEIASRLDKIGRHGYEDYSHQSTAIWDDLTVLFDLINTGKHNYGVPAYNGGMFDGDANPFLSMKKMSDWHLSRLIDHLGRAQDERHPDSGLYRVDYRDLQIQHLGNIYEGLLELHPHIAGESMIVIRSRSKSRYFDEKTVPQKQPIPHGFEAAGIVYHPGDVYLLTSKGERRSTGSYYTPNHIVDYLVENTLGPLCSHVDSQLRKEVQSLEQELKNALEPKKLDIERRLTLLKTQYDDRILNLRILDPAMGSGHFLLRACQYLAEEIVTHPFSADPALDVSQPDENALIFWERKVVEHCLYGVDLNPLAVELAKLALWLETVSSSQPLTFLDHHLRHGNSLVGAQVSHLGSLPGSDFFSHIFQDNLTNNLPAILAPLASIGDTPSDTTVQVKEKERLYRKVFDKIRQPFMSLADIWCSTFYVDQEVSERIHHYQELSEAFDKPARFTKLLSKSWASGALEIARLEDNKFFHWEFEFPEVFFTASGRRPEAGFDAIIGNPPYDVLSERENHCDLSSFKDFLASQECYQPSIRGKNNLYKLFICRALDLLCDGGRLGFIVPMAILGDDQAAAVRQKMLAEGSLIAVEAFPQKDDPSRRVFPEAKLSTAVFVYMKTPDREMKNKPFIARVHPAQYVVNESPSLHLAVDDIPLYDASNLSIVSCSQEDWDLAVRIMKSGRMSRLRDFTEFFQGEVNETNERTRGNLTDSSSEGKLVVRGASICLYVHREASQGNDIYLNVEKFLKSKNPDTKAFHHEYRRVALQESSPQNNFRRIISAIVPKGEYFNHTVNYCSEKESLVHLEIILACLNTKLSEWYFRLGSTNAHVSHYQLYNLPFPNFSSNENKKNKQIFRNVISMLDSGSFDSAFDILKPYLESPPFDRLIEDIITEIVKKIILIEHKRNSMTRSDRSALHPQAQPYQDLLDRIFFTMAGLSDTEVAGLEHRLKTML